MDSILYSALSAPDRELQEINMLMNDPDEEVINMLMNAPEEELQAIRMLISKHTDNKAHVSERQSQWRQNLKASAKMGDKNAKGTNIDYFKFVTLFLFLNFVQLT